MKNKNSLETFELNNKSKLREEAIDRENTLMNVLKSVKSKQSKEDLAGGDSTTSKGNLVGETSFSSVPASNSFVWVSDPIMFPIHGC